MLNFRLKVVKAGQKEFRGSKVDPIGVIEIPSQGTCLGTILHYFKVKGGPLFIFK